MSDPFFSLTQLRYLIALDQEKSFHRAATACNVSQPTLSMQIQKIEDYYGVKIFLRTKRKVETTEKGRVLLRKARQILKEAEELHSQLEDENKHMMGTYKIGIIPTIAPFLLPLFIKNFEESYPQANLEIQELQTHEILEALKEDRIDVGLLATPIKGESLNTHPIYYEEFLFYVPPNSSYIKKEKIKTSELPLKSLLLLEDGHCFKEQALEICHRTQKDLSPFHLKTGSIQTLLNLCDKQGYYTFLPELSQEYLSSKQKKQVKKISPSFYREISLITQKNYPKENLIQSLKEEIQKGLPTFIKLDKPKKVLEVPG